MSDHTPANAVVWFEIPVSDLDKAAGFYETVLDGKLADMDMGNGPIKVFSSSGGPGGNLFVSDARPASQMVVHLDAPKPLEDALERVRQAGGAVVSPIVPLPSGRFAYCTDPDGNRIGLFNAS